MIVVQWIAFLLVFASGSGILLYRNWRWIIALLAAQYLGVFLLVQSSWSLSLAAVKLVAGWMICVALGLAHLNRDEEPVVESSWPQGWLFRLVVIALILLVTSVGGRSLADWLGMEIQAAWGGTLLITIGFFQMGLTSQPFRVIVGLLTALAGFEILYAAVESSALVAGLLVLINLGLALSGAYFLIHQEEKVKP
jgi:hypothetical protein